MEPDAGARDLLPVKEGSVRREESLVTPAAQDASKTFHKIRAFPKNDESHFNPVVKALAALFQKPLFSEQYEYRIFGMEFAHFSHGWMGVDPHACQIGPRLVTAFRRRRDSKQQNFPSFGERPGLSRSGGGGLRCAHRTVTPFSFGAPQALTLVGHNSAQSRRATTDRSGLIAMDPAAFLPPARSLRTDITRSKSSVDDRHPARLFRATLLYPGPSRSETDRNRNRPHS